MSSVIRFSIAPIFFLLAIINLGAERAGLGHAGHDVGLQRPAVHAEMDHSQMNHAEMGHDPKSQEMATPKPVVEKVVILGIPFSKELATFLTSMSLMYWLMGFAHITPWFGLIGRSGQGEY